MRSAILGILILGIFGGVGHVFAEQGANVDKITFIQHTDQATAIDAVQSGNFDIYFYPIPHGQIEDDPPDDIQIFDSVGGVRFNLYVNPADVEEQFNPFAYSEIRYALNFLVDRDDIVDNLFHGNGHAILSNFGVTHPDYLLVHRELGELGIKYDPELADKMISEVLEAKGATKLGDTWHMDGEPITITIFIRNDDPIRTTIGNSLYNELVSIGFKINVITGNLRDAFNLVYASNPADFKWHIYTGAFSGSAVTKSDNTSLGVYYAPWRGFTPGEGNPAYWNYKHDRLDKLTQLLYYERYNTLEERAELVRLATLEGVKESVRIFLAVENERYVANDEVTGIVNTQGYGITHRSTPINVDVEGGDLKIGVKYISQSSWNPVLGFGDSYSRDIYNILTDPGITTDPFTGELIPARSTWKVETVGPEGTMEIPNEAVLWSPANQKWNNVNPDATARSKVEFDLKFSNWHHGIPMSINDIMYPLYFTSEWSSNDSTHPDDMSKYDGEIAANAINSIKGIHITSPTSVEIYTDYWNSDEVEIAGNTSVWIRTPWEIYAAMEKVVLDGDAAFSRSNADINNIPWLSLLESSDSNLVKNALEDIKSRDFVPVGLFNDEDTHMRYDASIKWITDKGNAMISNGPFYLDRYDKNANTLIATAFNDPTYPLEQGYWSYLAEKTSGLEGEITIGSLTPITGGATTYGKEIRETSDLALKHFNEYLKLIDANWSLTTDKRDSETSSTSALRELKALNDAGIKIVDGPAIDYAEDIMHFANENDMLLVSCCSATVHYIQDGDGLFRMAPGHMGYAKGLAQTMDDEGISTLIPVGYDNWWINDLLKFAEEFFAKMDAKNITTQRISYTDDIAGAITELVEEVERQTAIEEYDRVAILLGEFQNNVEFIKMASQHEILGKVKWYGMDFNTVEPNVTGDATASEFAEMVNLTVVQPSVRDNSITQQIQEHFKNGQFVRPPSVYTSYEYDTIWMLGLALLEAQSTETSAVKNGLEEVSKRYVGASGHVEFNAAGDRANGEYSTWKLINGKWIETRIIDGPILTNNIQGNVIADINGNGTRDDGRSSTNYEFTNPLTGLLEQKHALLVLHDEYIFGAGYYTEEDPREETVINATNNAVSLYEQNGTDAFATITALDVSGDAYPFVINAETSMIIADGSTLDRRGQVGWSEIEMEAAIGDVKDMLEEGVWINYVFLNPATGEEQAKRSWVIQQDEYIFGAGYYLEGIDAQIVSTEWSIAKAIAGYEIDGKRALFDSVTLMRSTAETYPFILDRDGVIVAHGANPRLVGVPAEDVAVYDKTQDEVLAELDGSADVGIGGVTITITDEKGKQITTTTAEDGTYNFENVGKGTFNVTTTPIPAMHTTSDGTSNQAVIVLKDGQTEIVDFMLKVLRPNEFTSINITAYLDKNANGEKDTNENGIQDVSIMIYTPSTDAVVFLNTGSDGTVAMSDLSSYDFYAIALPPQGYRVTTDEFQLDNTTYTGILKVEDPMHGKTYSMEIGVTWDNISSATTPSLLSKLIEGTSNSDR